MSANTNQVGSNPCAEVPIEHTIIYCQPTYSYSIGIVGNYAKTIKFINSYVSFGQSDYTPSTTLNIDCAKCDLKPGDFVNVIKQGTNLDGPAEYLGCLGATAWNLDAEHMVHIQVLNGYRYHNDVRAVMYGNLNKL